MLVEDGFKMVSVDASDKMLKYALKSRWDRRKEPAFDQWGRPMELLKYNFIAVNNNYLFSYVNILFTTLLFGIQSHNINNHVK